MVKVVKYYIINRRIEKDGSIKQIRKSETDTVKHRNLVYNKECFQVKRKRQTIQQRGLR